MVQMWAVAVSMLQLGSAASPLERAYPKVQGRL
jgi:hypothetical protein